MNHTVNIADIFPKHLFWDIDHSKLDLKKDRDIIIPRALYATTPESFDSDISELEKHYTNYAIVTELKNTKEHISNQVCLLVANRYHIPRFLRFKIPNPQLNLSSL